MQPTHLRITMQILHDPQVLKDEHASNIGEDSRGEIEMPDSITSVSTRPWVFLEVTQHISAIVARILMPVAAKWIP